MIITCENCATRFTLDESLLKPEGSKVRCSQCRHIFIAMPPAAPARKEDETVPVTPEEVDFDSSQDPDADTGDLDFDSEFEAVDFDQDLGFDDTELGFDEGETAPEDTGETDAEEDMAVSAEEIEFEMPDLEGPDFEMEEDQDTPLAFDADPQDTLDDAGVDDAGMDELEMDELPDSDSDDLESIEFEDLGLEDSPNSTDETDIEISFDEDDAAQDLSALSLEMDPPDASDASEELDLESQDISLETEDLEFEGEDDLLMGLDEDQAPEVEEDPPPVPESFEMDMAAEEDQEVRAEDLLEPDLELSFEDDLEMEEIAFDEPPEENEAGEPDEQAPAFPEVEAFQPKETGESGIDLSVDDEDEFDPLSGQSLEDEKFAGYDEVLEQDTEPEQDFPELDEELNDQPVSPPAPEAQPAPAFVPPEAPPASPLISPPPETDGGKRRIKKRKGRLGTPVKILVLLFFLIIAAYLISLRLGIHIPFMDQVKIPFITQAFKPAPPPVTATGPIPNDAATNGKFVTNDTAGRLFIITGKVDNPDKIAYSNIRIRGTLLTKGNKKAATQVIYCGNVISDEDLKSGNIADIAKQLSVKQGMQNTNVNVRPATSVHFMLVFSNLPENLTNFTVEVLDYKQAGPQ